MGDFIQNTILPAFMKFVNTRGVRAIKDGMMFTMPLIIVGAVYLLLFQLPIEAAANFITSLGIVPFLSHGYTSTFQIIAMVCAVGVGYTWAKNDGWEPLSAGVISLAAFLILIPDYVGTVVAAGEDGVMAATAADSISAAQASIEGVEGALALTTPGLNKTWLAGQGMIGAILAGLLTGLIYSAFMKKDIRIKMPAGVPDGVAAAFTGLIPAAVICTLFVVIYGISEAISGVTPIELIYKWIQSPLQGVGDSLPGVIIFETLIPLLWFFGVHGATVVGSVAQPIALMNQADNAAIFQRGIDAGLSRDAAIAAIGQDPNGHIFTEAFQNCFQAISGSGITIGLVVFMVFFAKSAQMKQVGKLGLGCGIFNINEPVLFGTPIVLNPKLLVPFIIAPLFCNIGAYILTQVGFIPYTMGVTVPWTTPPILSGLLAMGWQAALWQAIALVASFFIYMPFAKSVDNDYLAMEQAQEEA